MTEKDNFITMLKDDPKLKEYHRLEAIINQNKQLKSKLNQLKSIQKQMINAEKIEKENALKKIKNEYDNLLEEILEYPLMTTYLDLQNYFNEILKQTTEIIENSINSSLKI
ncbi:Biofilm formation family protein, YmcA [Alteracholeplasma palmae J233]|uniref:Biofilm formation family protein, YmcA n=1 Tax=Alteracholeplasma palmae (strain ATCC 49389 / J233) TaxID=1318466 RepID=U4KKL1_ALTPJ|nr:YlbF family regulator [Alteracholeplasma palmae]CCV64294.1 Biofilm formation family protein, YmcA [Alteracholeplasma palmae J233]